MISKYCFLVNHIIKFPFPAFPESVLLHLILPPSRAPARSLKLSNPPLLFRSTKSSKVWHSCCRGIKTLWEASSGIKHWRWARNTNPIGIRTLLTSSAPFQTLPNIRRLGFITTYSNRKIEIMACVFLAGYLGVFRLSGILILSAHPPCFPLSKVFQVTHFSFVHDGIE